MDSELATLVATGATTVVGLMVTETWEQARQRVVRLFARTGEATTVDEDLDESRDTLAAVAGTSDEGDFTSDITAMVRLRLRRLLEQAPDAADELHLFIEEFAAAASSGETGGVHNSITGGMQHGPVFQGQSFSNLTIHSAGAEAPDQQDT
ncbi:hypothetical protein [Streptomyces sp. GESEQ-35]|uniref:hypothetical protein n=1 Tax=Streptomyces sp. GESEQ-35 TaxID=2812657 RepID=UPI001B328563|nr:hypothetical protein [Streptomyces sp. GESEQ-35]